MRRASRDLADRLNVAVLRSFVRVVEHGSISAAARSLFLTQSAVSMQIMAMNSLVGAPLLERVRGGRWQPTAAGKTLYKSALDVLATVGRLEQSLADVTFERSGHVTLAATRVVAELVLGPVIAGFNRDHPNLRLDVQLCGCREIEQMLDKRLVEAALVADPFFVEGCSVYEIGEDELVAIVPRAHRFAEQSSVTVEDLTNTPLVSLSEMSSVWAFVRERLGDTCDDFEVLHSLSSASAVISLVEEGIGCALLPKKAAERGAAWADVVVRPVADVELRRRLLLAVARDAASENLSVFVSWIRGMRVAV